MYPVAYAVFDSETKENWDWFMENLKSAIGTPDGLVICTDACKGLETAVHTVMNNIAESFNSMIKKLKGFPVLELLDALRE